MRSRDFCYWLQGFFELGRDAGPLSHEQAQAIKAHLALVFEHEIDPSIDGRDPEAKAKLDAIHAGGRPPSKPVMRC